MQMCHKFSGLSRKRALFLGTSSRSQKSSVLVQRTKESYLTATPKIWLQDSFSSYYNTLVTAAHFPVVLQHTFWTEPYLTATHKYLMATHFSIILQNTSYRSTLSCPTATHLLLSHTFLSHRNTLLTATHFLLQHNFLFYCNTLSQTSPVLLQHTNIFLQHTFISLLQRTLLQHTSHLTATHKYSIATLFHLTATQFLLPHTLLFDCNTLS